MWISHLFEFAQMLLEQPQYVESCPAFSPQQREAWDSLLPSVASLTKKVKKGQTSENKAFLQLFLLVGMHLFKAPEELLDIIRDLQSCVERAHKKKKHKKSGEEQEPEWVEVLVELLLSLLSQPSRHMRQVCKMVFSSVCPHITLPALTVILNVLQPEQDEADSVVVLTEDDKSQSEEEEEEEHIEEGSDSDDGDTNDEEDTDHDDEDDDDDKALDEDEDEEVDPQFRLQLMKVLEQQNALAKEEDSSGEEDLDDEAMMKLDSSLAAVFSEQKKKVQAKKDEKSKLKKEKTLIRDFKIKVLDLVEVFVTRQSSSPLVLALIQPLLTLLERGMGSDSDQQEQDLLRRAAHILRNELFRSKVYCRTVADRTQELHEQLETLLNKLHKLQDSSLALYYFSACLYLVKVLRGAPPTAEHTVDSVRTQEVRFMGSVDVDRVALLFRAALSTFFTRRKSPLTTQMFSDLFCRFPVLCVDLLDTAVQNITGGVREHQQGQACVLVLRALQSREVQLLLSGDPWTELFTKVTSQLVTSVEQMCGSEPKALKDKLQQVLELCQCVLGHIRREKLPVPLESLQNALQALSSTTNFNKTGRLEDTYWAVMKRFGVVKPKAEKVKSNQATNTKTVTKKRKGFLPETKKRNKRKVLETTATTTNVQTKEDRKKTNNNKKKAHKRPAGGVVSQDIPAKKSKPLKKKMKTKAQS